MPSSEKVISPGVFTNEIDQSFLPAAVSDIGAAIIGPTVKGPALVPTIVSNYSEFQQTFGDTLKSGSNSYTYLTSLAAKEYLKHSGVLTVVRILDGNYTPSSATVTNSNSATDSTYSSASIKFLSNPTGSVSADGKSDEVSIGGVDFTFVSSSANLNNTSAQIFVPFGIGDATPPDLLGNMKSASQNLVDAINNSSSLHGLSITASRGNTLGAVVANDSQIAVISASTAGVNTLAINSGSGGDDATHDTFQFVDPAGSHDTENTTQTTLLGGSGDTTSVTTAFKLHTLTDGAIMNNSGSEGADEAIKYITGSNEILSSGSKHNVRWEVPSKNNNKGTFNLLVRQGNDSIKRKQVLETWNNVSLDPNSTNYIAKMVGDQKRVFSGTESEPYIAYSGSYPNKSKYIRVEVITTTADYLDENGGVRIPGASSSLPALGSGSYAGSFGSGDNGWTGFDSLGNGTGNATSVITNFYENISTQTQGYNPATADQGKTAYTKALNLLSNQDEYDINMILMPGITSDKHSAIVQKAIDVCEDRGETFTIIDPVVYGSNVTTAQARGEAFDSSYASMYWPWVQIPEAQLGKNVWVPPSVALGGIYAFNDKVAHPWFAPAGLNRGGIDTAIQAERKLTQGNRDSLYDSSINPIATFPGQGVCVWGQKTLQKKSSALDRVNVRRLLIKLKKFIASTSRFLVFEQNTSKTRGRFLNIVNPYMEQVQSNSGLSAFRIVMDETNNTPDIVDRNILYGQIFIQPTRTAEFIILDFTVQPTGATFPE